MEAIERRVRHFASPLHDTAMAAVVLRVRAARRLAHTLRSARSTPAHTNCARGPSLTAPSAATAPPARRAADAHSALAAASLLRRHLSSGADALAPDRLTLSADKPPSGALPAPVSGVPPDEFDDT